MSNIKLFLICRVTNYLLHFTYDVEKKKENWSVEMCTRDTCNSSVLVSPGLVTCFSDSPFNQITNNALEVLVTFLLGLFKIYFSNNFWYHFSVCFKSYHYFYLCCLSYIFVSIVFTALLFGKVDMENLHISLKNLYNLAERKKKIDHMPWSCFWNIACILWSGICFHFNWLLILFDTKIYFW